SRAATEPPVATSAEMASAPTTSGSSKRRVEPMVRSRDWLTPMRMSAASTAQAQSGVGETMVGRRSRDIAKPLREASAAPCRDLHAASRRPSSMAQSRLRGMRERYVAGSPLHLALREMHRHFTDARVLGAMAIVALILGFAGPFGTYA